NYRWRPARSRTFTCFETALNDMSKGWARSVTRAAPFASCWTISRRVGSESAAKARAIGGDIVVNPAVSTYHPAMRCPSSHTENREGPQFPSDEEIVRARAGVTCNGGRGPKKRGHDAAYGC